MDITVTAVDVADTEATEQAYEIAAECVAADLPDFPPVCRQLFLGQLHRPDPGTERRYALAHLAGQPVGLAKVTLFQLDNTDNVDAEISVLPRYRRRGVGRALHEYVVRVARDNDRKRLFGMTVHALAGGPPRDEAGRAFARAMGATCALSDVRRRLDLAELDRSGLDRILAESRRHADGYTSVCWRDVTPEEYADDVAYLDSRLLQDAPLGDLQLEPERVDATRLRGTEAMRVSQGRRRYHAGMRHEASGRIVAWTVLEVGASAPWHAFQQITIVDPEHRGHRLGAIAKIENLRHIQPHEPELRVIDTWNAAGNDHMIAINEAIGFRPVDGWENWQLTL
ncbi:MAG TPA: GNAT family N-acetyltransferase [Micromonosporaceae bacterium]